MNTSSIRGTTIPPITNPSTADIPAAAIILTESAVSVSGLLINRKEVADYLRPFDEKEREEKLLRAIEVGVFCLERAAASQDIEFVRREIESLLHRVQIAVGNIPAQTEKALLEKIGTSDGQVLAPVSQAAAAVQKAAETKLQEVKTLLDQDLDPSKQTTTLGKALTSLRELLDPQRNDSIQGRLNESVRNITQADGQLADAIRKVVEGAVQPLALSVNEMAKEIRGQETAAELAQQTTLKGDDFELAVVQTVSRWASTNGAELQHIGPDNEPGDVVLTVSGDGPTPGLTIVIEAKDRGNPVGRKGISDHFNVAMDKRKATSGIWVSKTPAGFAKEIGEWAEGRCNLGPWVACTAEHLITAIRFALAHERLAQLRVTHPEFDATSVGSELQRARTSLKRIANINTKVTDIRNSVDAIRSDAEQLRDEIKDALAAAETALSASPSPAPSPTQGQPT